MSEEQNDVQDHGATGSRRSRWARTGFAGLSGLIAGFCALAVAELASAVVRPEAGPVAAVGGAVIDRTPPAVKDFAVRHFGTADKLVLQLGILTLLAVFAVAVGILASRHRRLGSAAVLVFGVLGAVAAVGRPEGGPADALPSVVGAVVAAGALYLLVGRLGPVLRPAPAAGVRVGPRAGAFDRRGFVIAATAAAAASAGAGLLGRRLTASVQAGAAASRRDLVATGTRVAGARRAARGGSADSRASSFITPNKSFYRVDTALVVPRIDAGTWRLRIHGKGVARPLTVSLQDLLGRELIERDITLTCVSNEVGGPYVGNARWIGVRLADLLREAGVRPPSRGGAADQLVARSVDGMTIGTPVETVMDGRDAMLAVGMNGEPLPFEHGFPVRMVVPGLYGYVSACKWIKDIELTTFDAYDAYWVRRGWSRRRRSRRSPGSTPHGRSPRPKAGLVPVAGVAWAQHRGIARVEVRVDGGAWQPARLAAEDSRDTWRQWVWQWDGHPGRHTLEVRATDGDRRHPDRRARRAPSRTARPAGTRWWSTVA